MKLASIVYRINIELSQVFEGEKTLLTHQLSCGLKFSTFRMLDKDAWLFHVPRRINLNILNLGEINKCYIYQHKIKIDDCP